MDWIGGGVDGVNEVVEVRKVERFTPWIDISGYVERMVSLC